MTGILKIGKHLLFRKDFSKSTSLHKSDMGTLYDFKFNDLDGKEVDFRQYYGNISLVINTACLCGLTKDSFGVLQRLYSTYNDKGFTVLAFPSDEFSQEYSTDDEIKKGAKFFKLTFPFFTRSRINGSETNPVYKFLKGCFPGDITWNFSSKFIIDADGVPVKRFEKESWDDIEKYIVQIISEKDSKDSKKNNSLKRDNKENQETKDSKEKEKENKENEKDKLNSNVKDENKSSNNKEEQQGDKKDQKDNEKTDNKNDKK